MAIAAAALWFLIRYTCIGLWWVARYAIPPATVFVSIAAWRWFTGADLRHGGRSTGARWLHGSAGPVRQYRWGIRIGWAHWPGCQRTGARTLFAAAVCALISWPAQAASTIAALLVLLVAAAVGVRHRRRRLARPRRVDLLTATRGPIVALAGSPTLTVSNDTGAQSYATR